MAGLPIRVVRNPDHEKGQPTSVVAGVRALRRACDAVMIVLGDQPQVTSADLDELVAAYGASARALDPRAAYQGRRGNPIIFATRFSAGGAEWGVNVGCRRLIESHAKRWRAWRWRAMSSQSIATRREDYERLVLRLGGTAR